MKKGKGPVLGNWRGRLPAWKNVWRGLLILPPVLIGVAVLVFVVTNRPAPARKAPEETALAVRVLTVQPLTLHPRVRGFGTVRPVRVWNAIAQVGGKVIFVHPNLKKGAIVPAGTEIITIAPDDYKLAIAQAEAAIRTAEAKLTELTVNESNTRKLLALEKDALQVARTDYERKKTLREKGTIPATVAEQALRAWLTQRKQVTSLENALRLFPVQKRELEAQLASYRSQLATARLNLKRTHVRMPFDGRISLVAVEVGQFVPVGKQLAAADAIAKAEVEGQFPLGRMREVFRLLTDLPDEVSLTSASAVELIRALGLAIEVRLETQGGPVVWKGRFARLSDTVDPKTRTMGVIGEIDDPYSHVAPGRRPPLTKGMFVRMDILTRPVGDVLIIPRAALHGDKLFLVSQENRLVIRPVTVAARLGDLLVIGSGLKPGDKVVLSEIVPALAGLRLAPKEDAATAKRIAEIAGGGAGK